MLNKDLLDLINSGDCWALVGAGVSSDAGLPSWTGALNKIVESLSTDQKEKYVTAGRFSEYVEQRQYPKAFSILRGALGTDELRERLGKIILSPRPGGPVAKTIARWPFRCYVTTNYESILPATVQELDHGFVVRENDDEGMRFLNADPQRMVFRVHGNLKAGTRSLITQEDYDDLYTSDAGRPFREILTGALSSHRLVVFGFSFDDEDLRRILRVIRDRVPANKPIYAFLPTPDRARRRELELDLHVEIIHYDVHESGDHSNLQTALHLYDGFVLPRNMTFRAARRVPEEPSPAVTSLLLHSTLEVASDKSVDQTVEAWKCLIISHCSGGQQAIADVKRAIGQRTGYDLQSISSAPCIAFEKALAKAKELELITVDGDKISVAAKGQDYYREGRQNLALIKERFDQSIEQRVREALGSAPPKALVEAVRDFLFETVKSRGLWVARHLARQDNQSGQRLLINLLQGLPSYLKLAETKEQALASLKAVRLVLSSANDDERTYLGALCQAYFKAHLLGIDPGSLPIRRDHVGNTAFLLDSSVLIPITCVNDLGYKFATVLLSKLLGFGSYVFTTGLLVTEAAEHARWAWRLVQEHGEQSTEVLQAASGTGGFRTNHFLCGWAYSCLQNGYSPFLTYLKRSFPTCNRLQEPRDGDLQSTLATLGVPTIEFANPPLEGLGPEDASKKDAVQTEIKTRRENKYTYTHVRQVRAEAEVAVVIDGLRTKLLVQGRKFSGAQFVSQTRVIDNLPSLSRFLSVEPESLFQWTSSVSTLKPEETKGAFDGMIVDLAGFNGVVMEESALRAAFSQLIDTSSERLQEMKSEYEAHLQGKYAANPSRAFEDVDDLSRPIVADRAWRRMQEDLAEELQRERSMRQQAEQHSTITDKEKQELQVLKAKAAARKKKHLSRQRGDQFKKKKRK